MLNWRHFWKARTEFKHASVKFFCIMKIIKCQKMSKKNTCKVTLRRTPLRRTSPRRTSLQRMQAAHWPDYVPSADVSSADVFSVPKVLLTPDNVVGEDIIEGKTITKYSAPLYKGFFIYYFVWGLVSSPQCYWCNKRDANEWVMLIRESWSWR